MQLRKFLDTLGSYQPHTQTLLCADGTYLPVTVVGTGEPVVLLHAFGMDARHFLPFVLPLAGHFRFYLPHFRGYGLAKHLATTELDFIAQYADDVDALLIEICQQHEVDAVDLGAFSMGALVAWAHFNRYVQPDKQTTAASSTKRAAVTGLADDNDNETLTKQLTYTHKVKRYLNIDQAPVLHHQPDYQGGVFGDEQAKIFDQFAKVLAATLPYVHGDSALAATVPFTHLPYAVKRQIVDIERAFSLMSLNRTPMRWLANITGYHTPYKLARYNHQTWQQKMRCLQAYLELPYDYRAGLEQLTIPVTFIVGGQSNLYRPLWQRAIAQKLPNATVIEVPHAGHAVPVDAPLKFARLLKNFLMLNDAVDKG